jgi:hypothetical protein
MLELLPDKLRRQGRKHGATGPVVAAKRRLCRVDDLSAAQLRPGAGAQRHRIHMGHEQEARLIAQRAVAGKIDDQVSGFGRHRDALVRVIETDGALRHAGFLKRRRDVAPDQRLATGNALDRQEAHETLDGGILIDGHDASFTDRFC